MTDSVHRTHWLVQTSVAYDALCLLNILTGDSFYTSSHPGVFERWQPRLQGQPLEAFKRLEYTVRTEHKGIISAWLCLFFSGVQPRDLNDLIQAALEPEPMLEAYRNSVYFEAEQARVFATLLPDLLILFQFLAASPFELEHQQDLGLVFQDQLAELERTLNGFDIVAVVEQHLGRKLNTPEIEVFMLAYTAPHGLKLMGNRFITSKDWQAVITVQTAIHELMHPPFDHGKLEVQDAIQTLEQDLVLKTHFEQHDPAFGYNTWAGYVEENCVRALDQVIGEGFGVARDATERWEQEDGGMHMLAARLTPLLRARKISGGSFEDWFIAQVFNGSLQS